LLGFFSPFPASGPEDQRLEGMKGRNHHPSFGRKLSLLLLIVSESTTIL